MCEPNLRDTPQSFKKKNVWLVTQHHPVDTNFPFVVEATDMELSMEFPSAHHRCCWTRTMLAPLWSSLEEFISPLDNDHKHDLGHVDDNSRNGLTRMSLLEKYHTLNYISSSIRELLKHQQNKLTPKKCVWRVRFAHAVPGVICFGKGVESDICITLSLRSRSQAKMVMFPSFIAIQPTESTNSIIKLKSSIKQRRHASHTDADVILLPLQHTNTERTVATYMSFVVDLCGNASLRADIEPILMAFHIFAAFYDSPEEQIKLDEPFTNLQEGRSNVTREERFGVMSPEMDPHVVFAMEKRTEVKLKRHIKTAMEHMDGITKGKRTAQSPKAHLCHVATLQSTSPVPIKMCEQPGCGTLAAVLPGSVQWPLQLRVSDTQSGKMFLTRSIPGSVSLDRLANELESLYSQLGYNEEK